VPSFPLLCYFVHKTEQKTRINKTVKVRIT
jgi:hypothetical protein